MIGRRAVIGLSLLSMLVFCAVAAPSAFATKGTTGYTCVKLEKNEGDWKDAHCTEEDPTFKSPYGHIVIKEKQETTITASNKNTANNTIDHTPAVLSAEPLAGTVVVVTCTTVHGTGTQTNNLGPPMNVSGNITTEFSECTATLNGKACESVNEGKAIPSKANTSTPTEKMEVEFKEAGEPFASFNVKCNKTNIPITVKGFATGIPKGATIEFTKASTEGGLTVGGKKAWFETKTTVTMSTTESAITLTTTAS